MPNISSIFSNPLNRAGLEKYYETMKADAIASAKAREADPAFQENLSKEFKGPDGQTHTFSGNLFTAELMEKSFVPFDKWLDLTQRMYDSQQRMHEATQKSLDFLTAQTPDSPSGVHSTFSHDGVLLAYVNKDGSFTMSNSAHMHLNAISAQAENLNLTGQARAEYLHKAISEALSKNYNGLEVTEYTPQTSPTKREFAQLWYKDFDIDQAHTDAIAEAKKSLESMQQWQTQMQSNFKKMQDFLLSNQEAA